MYVIGVCVCVIILFVTILVWVQCTYSDNGQQIWLNIDLIVYNQ